MLVTDLYEGFIHYIQHIYNITENKVVNPTTTSAPVAPQVVTTTTHGATKDDEVDQPTNPCLQRLNMQYKIKNKIQNKNDKLNQII